MSENSEGPSRTAQASVTVVMFFAVVALVLWKDGGLKYSHGPIDTAMFFAAMALIAWFLLPRRGVQEGHGQQTGNGIAFRLGKALHGVLRPRKR